VPGQHGAHVDDDGWESVAAKVGRGGGGMYAPYKLYIIGTGSGGRSGAGQSMYGARRPSGVRTHLKSVRFGAM
jgi:hypothetical protein